MEEIIKDISQKSIITAKSEPHETVVAISSAESTIEMLKKDVDKVGTSTLLKGGSQEETESSLPQDSVQFCPIEEQFVKVSYNKDNVNFVISTEELPSNVTNLEITVDTQPMKVDVTDEKHAKELSTASEVLTVSPVPIQVAESVLQVEPKESVSDSKTMSQEILSSTITPVHESNVPRSEISFTSEKKTEVHTSASAIEPTQNVEELELNANKTPESIDTNDKLSESCKIVTEASQILTTPEQSELTQTIASSPSSSSITIETETPTTCPNKNLQQEKESVEQIKESEIAVAKETEVCKPLAKSEVVEQPLTTDSPVRPSRAKELCQPSKSVQESPSQEKEKVMKKTAKKSLEKSMSEGEPTEMAEGDSGKKVVKKVVKKAVKKLKTKPEEEVDDGAEENNSASKPKKTVKVVKKGTKSAQVSDTDAPVLENPSSSTSDAPIPPKRKVKTLKRVLKKSDNE